MSPDNGDSGSETIMGGLTMEKTLIASLAEHACSLQYGDLPPEVIEKAKICMLDFLAMVVSGYDMEESQVAIRTTKLLGPPGKATVFIDGYKGRAIDCVLANSVLAHACLQDDWHPISHSHVGVAVLPTVFAIAEEQECSGREALLATVVGYEIEGRVGVLSVPAFTRGFRASSVYADFGTTAVAATLMGLSGWQVQQALSCAGSKTGGVLQPFIDGSMEWAFAEGFGCRHGILAALLAQQGLRGATNILEGQCGVNYCFAGTVEGQEEALQGLGEHFHILDVCFKRFPSGGANQGSIAVALDLAKRYTIDYRTIRAVRVNIPHTGSHERMNYAGIAYQGPFSSIGQCTISKPFGIAATLKNAALDIEIVRREMDNPEITELAHKIHLKEVQGMSGWSLSMEIELEDGTVIKGDGSNIEQDYIYLNRDRVCEKFTQMASRRLGKERTGQIIELVFGMEELESLGPIIERMVP
jgi:2-methylcitrate dehydratase PrpD